jgi:mannuronan 5-epimerase
VIPNCLILILVLGISIGLAIISIEGLFTEGLQLDIACVEYEPTQKLIKINCQSVRLTDIYNHLKNPGILDKEITTQGIRSHDNKNVWILNAGIIIEKGAGLIIDSSDTSWLKIKATPTLQRAKLSNSTNHTSTVYSSGTIAHLTNQTYNKDLNQDTANRNEIVTVSKNNGDNPNGIHVRGSLLIDSVKITSWDPETKDVIKFDFGKRPGEEHTKSDYDTAEPRAFIRISKDATGTSNITNSEIAYLGYSCSRCAGLSYYGGEGSVLKNNDIHHLLKGYYSKGMGYMLIENNKVHDNYLYGIDPHTGSHDIVIRNNKVYDNNASGIICSKDCYRILIEGNEVYRNGGIGRGIAFSINTTNSIARNNDVYSNERCISFNKDSNHNQVYNNKISNCDVGIYLSNTSKNMIYNNDIANSKHGIVIKHSITNNITNNSIDMTRIGLTFINKEINGTDVFPILYDKDSIGLYLDRFMLGNKLLDVPDPVVSESGKIQRLKHLLNS